MFDLVKIGVKILVPGWYSNCQSTIQQGQVKALLQTLGLFVCAFECMMD